MPWSCGCSMLWPLLLLLMFVFVSTRPAVAQCSQLEAKAPHMADREVAMMKHYMRNVSYYVEFGTGGSSLLSTTYLLPLCVCVCMCLCAPCHYLCE